MSTDTQIPEARAQARNTGQGRFQTQLDIAGHPLLADEPEAVGGNGTGPGPYDLLCAALATCTAMTLRLYAERKGWTIGEVGVVVTHRREATATPADVFDRQITLSPDLDGETRSSLLSIANRCPVHKTLTTGSRVETALA